jgi:hypothetical protein
MAHYRSMTTGRESYMPAPRQHPDAATSGIPQPYREHLPPHTVNETPRHAHGGGHIAIPSNITNRRPPIPARVASRRMSAQQQNQENSGDAEAAIAREEIQAASMRYAEDGVGLDFMDETPPRIGRFERYATEH